MRIWGLGGFLRVLQPGSILQGEGVSGESHLPPRKDNVYPDKLSQQRSVEEKVPEDAE
jgi:hypothetical protein